jgi:hypothetical protein
VTIAPSFHIRFIPTPLPPPCQLDEGDPIEDFVSRTNRLSLQDLRKLVKGFFDSTLGLQASLASRVT